MQSGLNVCITAQKLHLSHSFNVKNVATILNAEIQNTLQLFPNYVFQAFTSLGTHANPHFSGISGPSFLLTYPATCLPSTPRLTCHGSFWYPSKFLPSNCACTVARITVSPMLCQTHMHSPDGWPLKNVGKKSISVFPRVAYTVPFE